MAVKVGINGFGRIGRNVVRAGLHNADIEFVAVNDLTDTKTLAHLLKYDSVLGPLPETVTHDANSITVGGKTIKVFATKDPGGARLDQRRRRNRGRIHRLLHRCHAASKHLKGSVKKVIISAPAKNEDVTLVLGVNDAAYDPSKHNIISNASCTTNCLAPVVKVLHQTFGIEKGSMTTIHSYTNDQKVLDYPAQRSPPRPRRRAQHDSDHHRRRQGDRPGDAGTEGQAGRLLDARSHPGRLGGRFRRILKKPTTTEAVNAALKAAADGEMKGILGYTEDPVVSSDMLRNPNSSIVDSATHQGARWQSAEGGLLVRQRVGLLLPRGRPLQVPGRQGPVVS